MTKKAEIKNLVNKERWDAYQERNQDAYGGACVKIAGRIMQYLDENPTEFGLGYSPDMNTTHGIICHCNAGEGITGFMAAASAQMVATCY